MKTDVVGERRHVDADKTRAIIVRFLVAGTAVVPSLDSSGEEINGAAKETDGDARADQA